MKFIDIKLFQGRNVYSHKPVVKLTVSLGQHTDTPTNEINGFNDKLIYHFPNLKKHTCCLGYEGGFFERLLRGTYLAHVLEHLLIEVQNTFGYKVKYGKTLHEKDDVFNIFLEYENPDFITVCCKESIKVLNSFIFSDTENIEDFFLKLKQIKYDTDFGLSTNSIIQEAKKVNIPVTRISDQNLIRLNYGNKARFLQATLLDSTSCIAVDIASDKNLTKNILNQLNIPVPYAFVVSTANQAFESALDIDAPVVIKPLNSNQGKGVRTNLYTKDEITSSFDLARTYSRKVIVEKFIEGEDYRVLVVGNKVVAVAKRLPPFVIGDGKSTIKQLIEVLNNHPDRGQGHEKPLTKITINQKTHEVLKKQNYYINDIPLKDKMVKLCENCNLSTGGTSQDCTHLIHPNNAYFAVQSAKALNIHVAGVDFIAKDISKCIKQTQGAIIEVNAAPGIRMHLYPFEGQGRNVAKDILDYLYPNKQDANFPIISVTGTNGKTTTVRLISFILQFLNQKVGWTTTNGSYINQNCIRQGDNAGADSARQLLCQNIDIAVFETARGGILKKGLGYDLADVGVITNISNDHLGQHKINSIKDLANIKSLVVEAIKPNGFAVLNAEDELTSQIRKNVYENIIYFFYNKNSIKTQINKNHVCVYVENNIIFIKDKESLIKVTNINNIPITLKGVIKCNVYNCLAAVSALYALKTPISIIKKGLQLFKDNSGRFEVHEFDTFKIMLDYAHNLKGFSQVLQVCKNLNHNRLVGVIGMPNDRLESDIKSVAKLCSKNLDFAYIKEDKQARGKQKGQTSKIILQEMLNQNFNKNNIKTIMCEVQALKHAVKSHQKNDLIIVMYEDLKPLSDLVNNLKESKLNPHCKNKQNCKDKCKNKNKVNLEDSKPLQHVISKQKQKLFLGSTYFSKNAFTTKPEFED